MHLDQGLFLSVYVDDTKIGRTEEQSETHVGRIDETSWSISVRSSILGMYTARMQAECEQFFKVSTPCMDDSNSQMKNWRQLENCQKCVHKSS